MQGHEIPGDGGALLLGVADQLLEIVFGAELRRGVERDAIEPAVDGRRELPVVDSARALGWIGVQELDTEIVVGGPESLIGPRADDGRTLLRDHGAGVVQQPDRGALHQVGRLWVAEVLPPLNPHAGDLVGLLVGLEEHRLLFQEVDVVGGGCLLRPARSTSEDGDARDSARRDPAEAAA